MKVWPSLSESPCRPAAGSVAPRKIRLRSRDEGARDQRVMCPLPFKVNRPLLYSAPTAAEVRERLSYDQDTGVFRWRRPPNQRIKVGSIAGTTTPKGYVVIGWDGRHYTCGRLAWLYVYGVWPQHQIDHINRIKTDNRIANLRDVPDGVNKLNVDRSAVQRDRRGRFAAAAILMCLALAGCSVEAPPPVVQAQVECPVFETPPEPEVAPLPTPKPRSVERQPQRRRH